MLPGPFGLGVMGTEAYAYIDILHRSGFSAWQMLPVEHLGVCFSPYASVSAFAGEPMLIDPRGLLDMGLITQDELSARMHEMQADFIDYPRAHGAQWKILRTAFSRLNGSRPYAEFCPFWLDDFALYMALREHYGNMSWDQWPDKKLKRHDPDSIAAATLQFSAEMDFFRFVQWLFDLQWRKLKSYAKACGVALIGDMPIYISADSADVWSRRDLFKANADGTLPKVSGAPPDYFNPNGQRWGNPVYNWSALRREDYAWWTSRMQAAMERFDLIRLDHFRGFDRYWAIPADCPDGRGGIWVRGPGIALFHAMEQKLGKLPIIAEDLGTIDEGVATLLKKSGFPGMRVLQFGFDGDGGHLPHQYTENTVAYTGTHDNTTLLAWMFELDEATRERALFYLGFDNDWTIGGARSPINRAWIRTLYQSRAPLVVIPIQDILGYGADTRTNTPGTIGENWKFRIRAEALAEIDCAYYHALGRVYGRNPSPACRSD